MEKTIELLLGLGCFATLVVLTYHMVKCDTKLKGLTLTQWSTWSVLFLLSAYHLLGVFAPQVSPVPVQVFLYAAELCVIATGLGMALSLKGRDPREKTATC